MADAESAIKIKRGFNGYLARSYYYFKSGKYELALEDCNKAISLAEKKSDSNSLISYRGQIFYLYGKKELAIKDFESATKSGVRLNIGYFYLGQYYYNKKDYDNSRRYFNLYLYESDKVEKYRNPDKMKEADEYVKIINGKLKVKSGKSV